MMLVVDATLVAAALVDGGPVGAWADGLLGLSVLLAPHLMPVEVASILRRAALHGDISFDTAAMAHADLLSLRVQLFPYTPFADRVWDLRQNVTAYDAWYVALAEALDADLATVDLHLARASGPRCRFRTPPDSSSLAM
jgi:predicted nucleic acid-binding protein